MLDLRNVKCKSTNKICYELNYTDICGGALKSTKYGFD